MDLNSLEMEFDTIVPSEIGNDTSFYLSSFFTGYINFYELPKGNNYGGVAVFIKQQLKLSERYDLKLTKNVSVLNVILRVCG